MNKLKEYLSDFFALIFPDLCQACGTNLVKNEKIICLNCQLHLPYTNFHLNKENLVAKQFWGKIKIEGAAACFHFRKGGKVQHLLHQLKYKKQQEVGIKVGQLYGTQLKNHAPFDSIDYIIPVPLHRSKFKKRGYNQSECFAKGLSEAMNVELNTSSLLKTNANETQTSKTRFQRFKNTESIYTVADSNLLKNKCILLVDDVITTGSTIEACVNTLNSIEGIKICIAAIAYAK